MASLGVLAGLSGRSFIEFEIGRERGQPKVGEKKSHAVAMRRQDPARIAVLELGYG